MSYLQVTHEGAVAVATMNDPKRRNALSLEMRGQLIEALRELFRTDSCRAIVLTGAGGHFCSGGDVSNMNVLSVAEGRERLENVHPLVRMIVGGPKPIIAAVEGAAAGAGVSLGAAADYVVTATNARWQASFMRIGLLPDMGALWTVPRRVGIGQARRIFAFAEPLDGAEATRIGLADESVEPGSALPAALTVARKFAGCAPTAISLLRAALATRCDTLESTLSTEVDYQSLLFQTSDHKAAVKAFLEKRVPDFVEPRTGRSEF